MAGSREHLLIVDPDHEEPFVGLPGRVGHEVSPRLHLVEADAADLDLLRAHPAVLEVVAGPVPSDLTATLDDTERLFVEAWSLRNEPKRRRGDGADWGTEGFLPPDP
jgi:hypothetical protein